MKGSKDSNNSLDSKKPLVKKMAYWVVAQGQVKSAKKAKTCPHYDVTHRKTQMKKIFSI